MTKKGFIRRTVPAPQVPEEALTVPDVEEIKRVPQSRPPAWVWVTVFLIAVVVLMVLMYRSGVRQVSTGSFLIFPVMLMSMFMMLRNRAGGDRNARPAVLYEKRAEYLRTLDKLRAKVRESAHAQVREVAYHHPDPTEGGLLALVGTPRMWERGPTDRNFGHVRIGVGLTRLKATLIPPVKVPPAENRETVTAIAARDFLLAQNVVHDVGRPLHLFDQPGWCFVGADEQRPLVQGLLRAMLCQLCVFHGPDDVQVAIITDDMAAWSWAKWLPHIADDKFVDASGPARLIFSDVGEFVDRFGPELRERRPWAVRLEGTEDPARFLVVVVDYPGANCAPILGAGGHLGVSVLEATGDANSMLATSATAFTVDELGNLLKAERQVLG